MANRYIRSNWGLTRHSRASYVSAVNAIAGINNHNFSHKDLHPAKAMTPITGFMNQFEMDGDLVCIIFLPLQF